MKSLPRDGSVARDLVNRWVADATDGKISQLIIDPLDGETSLVLASALLFTGDWKNRFPKANTHHAPFHVGRIDIGVQMMSMAEALPHATIDDVELIDKPLGSGELSMTFLLPAADTVLPFGEVEALAALERALSPQKLSRWLGACKPETVDLWIPKFKISARTDLKRVLESLGVKQAFDPQKADFTGIVADTPLFVSQCIHEVRVEIDEDGAKASSATMVGGTFGGPPPPRPRFNANHPFLFLIRHRPTGLILFMGRVVEPPGPVSDRKKVDEPPKKPGGQAQGGGGGGMF
jgi:serpin B